MAPVQAPRTPPAHGRGRAACLPFPKGDRYRVVSPPQGQRGQNRLPANQRAEVSQVAQQGCAKNSSRAGKPHRAATSLTGDPSGAHCHRDRAGGHGQSPSGAGELGTRAHPPPSSRAPSSGILGGSVPPGVSAARSAPKAPVRLGGEGGARSQDHDQLATATGGARPDSWALLRALSDLTLAPHYGSIVSPQNIRWCPHRSILDVTVRENTGFTK